MATQQTYEVGAQAAADFVKANVPQQYSWVVQAHPVEAAGYEYGIAKAVIDAVDKERMKGMA